MIASRLLSTHAGRRPPSRMPKPKKQLATTSAASAEFASSADSANSTGAAASAAPAAPPMPRAAVAPQVIAAERPVPPEPPSGPSKTLHVFPNPSPARDYAIQFQIPEFTCLCPLTGQPDFAHFTIDMVADRLCVELKSLKLYLWSFRGEGAFHEKVTNDIVDEIARVTRPRFVRLTARWYVRGGIYTSIVAEHQRKGWKPQPHVELPGHPAENGLPR